MSWQIEIHRYGEPAGKWTLLEKRFPTRDEAVQYSHHFADTTDGTSIQYARFAENGEVATHTFERGKLQEA